MKKERKFSKAYLLILEQLRRLKNSSAIRMSSSTVYNIKRGRTPEEIMRACSFLTSLAIKLVFNPSKPENLKEKYNRALLIHLVAVILPWIIVAFNTSFAVLSAILSYIIHKLDFNYSKWKTDYEWFEVR